MKNKEMLTIFSIILITFYLCCVVLCNIEHNKKLGIKGMNPCGSCWALNVGDR